MCQKERERWGWRERERERGTENNCARRLLVAQGSIDSAESLRAHIHVQPVLHLHHSSFLPIRGGELGPRPGKGHSKNTSAEPALAEAQNQACPRASVIDLMWTVELRPEIPLAQPLEERLVVTCNSKAYHLLVPQNWETQEIMSGLRSEALRIAKKKSSKWIEASCMEEISEIQRAQERMCFHLRPEPQGPLIHTQQFQIQKKCLQTKSLSSRPSFCRKICLLGFCVGKQGILLVF